MSTDEWGETETGLSGPPATGRRLADDVQQAATAARADRLRRTIETEIVPRLLAARGRHPSLGAPPVAEQCAGTARPVAAVDCLELQRLLLAHESTVAGAYVEALISQGVPREVVYMDLLVPVARGFGQLWEDDTADFTQITVALGRLQVLLHELGRDSCDAGQGAHSVLLIPAPGEQHTFGLLVIGDFFRRHGWTVCCEFPRTARETLDLAADHHFDVIGLSLAADQKFEDLAALLPTIRRVSLNPDLRILVGGPLFVRRPDLALEIGADGTAADGAEAVDVAERLVAERVEMH